MSFQLGKVSLENLKGVHPDLVRVVKRAIEITEVDFKVVEGVRTRERQMLLVKAGASPTLNSLHIPQQDGFSHAVDLGALIEGKYSGSWPLYNRISSAMKKAAAECGVSIRWGGDFIHAPKDGPHFELAKK